MTDIENNISLAKDKREFFKKKFNIELLHTDESAQLTIVELKKELMACITDQIKLLRLKQREVGEILDIKQARVSDLTTGKDDRFSLDSIIKYAYVLGGIKPKKKVKSKAAKQLVEKYYADIACTPLEAEKNIEQTKAEVVEDLLSVLLKSRLKQREVSEILNIKQPRVSDLKQFKLELFSLEIVYKYALVFGTKKSLKLKSRL
ncbi:XRE family transcriptional regulator [Vibrio parahaemolyticus]|nr:XRE family transcriptional regulator [Vibrio parahaemolyticus]EKZ9227228.1 XRE family transcriptional regulator [Vibrio parahaemolyticus]